MPLTSRQKKAQNTQQDDQMAQSPGQLAMQQELAQLSYAEGQSMTRPGGALEQRQSPQGSASNTDQEITNPDQDANLENSMLVGGIQPDRLAGNFLARNWYHGYFGGPNTEGQGDLLLPYDDIGSVDDDIARVELYGNYASGKTSWNELQKQDPTGAQHIETLIGEAMQVASSGGVIYAHSGGGAATMAGLRRMLEVHNADAFRAQGISAIQVQGLEAVITAEQVDALGAAYDEIGVQLMVDNTIAGARKGGEEGSDTWRDLIAPRIGEGGETPHITHTYDGLQRGDAHSNMVPALYDAGKMSARSKK